MSVELVEPLRDENGTPVHCVRIYPKGPTKPEHFIRVTFPTKEVKEKYIRDEYRFCRAEEDAHNAARYPNQRAATKADLYAKRVTFAKQQNYAPKNGNKFEWVKQLTHDNNQVA